MQTVTHREMRNSSGEILRRVAAGESIEVTNNGRPTAIIVPVRGSALDGLIAREEARSAHTDLDALLAVKRVVIPTTSAELIDDTRGRW